MYGEAVQVVDALLRNEITTFDGQHYRLDEAPFRPGPVQQPRPPLTLAAHGPRMLRLIAPYADRWNSMGTPAEMRERGDRLDEALRRRRPRPGRGHPLAPLRPGDPARGAPVGVGRGVPRLRRPLSGGRSWRVPAPAAARRLLGAGRADRGRRAPRIAHGVLTAARPATGDVPPFAILRGRWPAVGAWAQPAGRRRTRS